MNIPQPMSPPPPPPPKKSSALKWILIGCGGVAFIGLIVCGGCVIWIVNFGKSVIKIQEEVETLVRNSPEIREELGEIKSVDPIGDQDKQQQGTSVVMRFQVKGEKGDGEVHARVKVSLTKFTLEGVNFETDEGRMIKLK